MQVREGSLATRFIVIGEREDTSSLSSIVTDWAAREGTQKRAPNERRRFLIFTLPLTRTRRVIDFCCDDPEM